MKKRTRAFRHSLWGLIGTLLVFVFVLSACSDDPILGPTEHADKTNTNTSSIPIRPQWEWRNVRVRFFITEQSHLFRSVINNGATGFGSTPSR